MAFISDDDARKALEQTPKVEPQVPSGPSFFQRMIIGVSAAAPFAVGSLVAMGHWLELRKISRDRQAKPAETPPRVIDIDADVK